MSAASARIAPRRPGRLLGHLGWYGAAEIVGRVSRLGATVVLARQLDSLELGMAALALTLFELIRVLANNGIGQAVIRADAAKLDATCATAGRLVWWLCLAVAALQVAVGAGMAALGIGGQAGAMLACLAGVYLLMAPGLVPVYLILRDQRLKVTAGISLAQVVVDNLLTITLVLADFGPWGVVLPKLLVAPIWLFAVRRAQPWRRNPAAGFVPVADLLRFAAPVLGSEILAAARLNLDNLLVGAILGVEALGLYYFIFNAGIGFSLSLTNALSTVLYPHLAAARGDRAALRATFDKALRGIVPGIAALIALQALAALVYVPIVFGARWEDAAVLVALLCASAVTRPFADASSQALRAAGETAHELRWAAANTVLYLGVFAAVLPLGLTPAIAALTITATLLQLCFALSARRALR
jgi:O-antigen/teichoic acid export membrane protein